MVKLLKTKAEQHYEDEQLERVARFAAQVCREGDLRGLNPSDVLISILSVFVLRNQQVTWDNLFAVMDEIRKHPVTEVTELNGQALQ